MSFCRCLEGERRETREREREMREREPSRESKETLKVSARTKAKETQKKETSILNFSRCFRDALRKNGETGDARF